ncbi:MAG: hypothetical protein IJC39_05790 [Firmicutes bacterium]|nr:hypothetical protein [Bacillota bacterium]
MKPFWQKFLSRLIELGRNRIFVVFAVISVMFLVITGRLFSLQIVNGEEYERDFRLSIVRTLSITAPRGNIYDRNGKPLAYNRAAFSVQIDDSVNIDFEDKTLVAEDTYFRLKELGYEVKDILPVSMSTPYEYTLSAEDAADWLSSVGYNPETTAPRLMEVLLEPLSESRAAYDEKRAIASLALEASDRNLMLITLTAILWENGETVVDDLPITESEPHSFTYESESRIQSFMESVGMEKEELSYSAEETMEYLEEFFGAPECVPREVTRKMLAMRYLLYLQRYKKYQPITVASEISDETLAAVSENSALLPGVSIANSSLRIYPYGEYFSHMLGYIRRISDTEYEEWKDYGYSTSDIVGKTGIERAFELELRGTDGERIVEVDNLGRIINSAQTLAPIPGDNIYLTIDADLQIAAYNYLEETLKDVLVQKLLTTDPEEDPISLKSFFYSLAECNNIGVPEIFRSETLLGTKVCNLITERALYNLRAAAEEAVQAALNAGEPVPEQKEIVLDIKTSQGLADAKAAFLELINEGEISHRELCLLLYEQGKLNVDENYVQRIRTGSLTPLSVVLQALERGDITPGDTNLDPSSGSVVVTSVDGGEVLALVTYPSYDNNRLVNTFDNEYYNKLLTDPSTPLINRPLSQKKAPGSTLKMAIAVAVLQKGVVTPETLIYDEGVFTKASHPYANCWIAPYGGSHGYVDMSKAIEVSCNYYFYEAAYRLGNAKDGGRLESINTLAEYLSYFGLNDYTGIEISESAPGMATPEYKKELTLLYNPDAQEYEYRWNDGDTIRVAIGQSINNFTPAQICKYITTLASGGTRYRTHLLDRIQTAGGTVTKESGHVVENYLEIDEAHMDSITDGMVAVGRGNEGTLTEIFGDFEIITALKSGTAQENADREDHVWTVGFAPANDPRVAITVMLPYGDAEGSPSAVITKNVLSEYFGLNYYADNTYMQNTLAD